MEPREIHNRLADAIIERPVSFSVNGERMFLYPATLGKIYLTASILDSLSLIQEALKEDIYAESLRVCKKHRNEVARLIALYTVRTREDHFDDSLISGRAASLAELDDEELATLLVMVLTMDVSDELISAYGIDKERDTVRRIVRYKSEKGSLSFCGRTIYGTMIDSACERYGWTLDYVVWGISFTNLKMMTADATVSMYLSPDDQRKLHVSADREVIDATDPKNFEKIRQILE